MNFAASDSRCMADNPNGADIDGKDGRSQRLVRVSGKLPVANRKARRSGYRHTRHDGWCQQPTRQAPEIARRCRSPGILRARRLVCLTLTGHRTSRVQFDSQAMPARAVGVAEPMMTKAAQKPRASRRRRTDGKTIRPLIARDEGPAKSSEKVRKRTHPRLERSDPREYPVVPPGSTDAESRLRLVV